MLYKIINTYADESDFILNLIDDHPYIGWYMLLRLGESDTTKATLTRRECIEIIRKDGSYARNIFSYVYKAVDITVGNIQEKADSIFGTAYEHILLNGLEILSRFASIANITEQKKLVVLMIKIIDADVVRRFRVLNDWIRQVMNVLDERVKISIVSKDKLVEIIEEEFGLNRLVKFEEIMQKGYAKEVVQYLYWARERYEFAVNYIDSISVKYLTDEKDFASMLEEL